MRHRRGTPGLTPYRLRTIEAGYPRRRRPARHLRRTSKSAGPTTERAVTRLTSDRTGLVARRAAGDVARRTAGQIAHGIIRRIARRIMRGSSGRSAGSQVAMGVAGAIALALLLIGGYQAAAGAAVVLGMF